jgi:hypothetical protein
MGYHGSFQSRGCMCMGSGPGVSFSFIRASFAPVSPTSGFLLLLPYMLPGWVYSPEQPQTPLMGVESYVLRGRKEFIRTLDSGGV